MRIGIDLGGTKIEVLALSGQQTELWRKRVATPQGNYRAILTSIADLVGDCERQLGRRGTVGIGIPGAESRVSGLIKNANSTCLIGRPLRRDLRELLGRDVRIANDANCFALSEATDGAAVGAKVVFGVILGTGVGGGVVVDGQALNGANVIAGEWGHNQLPNTHASNGTGDLSPPCYCGRTACIELYLSGPGLQRDHAGVTGEQLAPSDIDARANAGCLQSESTLQRYERRLAQSLAQVINILDPDVIVLGGGLSNIGRWYTTVPRLWGEWVFSDIISTRLVKNRHGDSSGVRGAAWLWPL